MKLYSIDKTAKIANILKKKGYTRATCIGLAIVMAAAMTSFNTKKKENDSHVTSNIPTFITMAQAKDHLMVDLPFSNDKEDTNTTYIQNIEYATEDENTVEIEQDIIVDNIEDVKEEVMSAEINNNVIAKDGDITVDNMDFFTREEIIAYICKKYNLTDFEFKVIASTVYHEVFANNYDDAYRVINTIYNRTKSKNWVNYVSYCTGMDGGSMYVQVTAPYQFDGCIKGVSGYDYETLLNTVIYDGTIPFETTLEAIFNFLLSEKSIHNFLSFKGIYYPIDASTQMQPGFGVTNWVKFTDLGNTYHDLLTKDDLIDENYNLAPYEDSVKILKRK